jgi:hypothetical protein
VLDEVLDGALRSEVSLLQQAKRLGHDLHAPHVAIVARFDQAGPIRNRDGRWSLVDEVMARRGSRILWRLRHNNAEIVWPVGDPLEARAIAKSLSDDLARRIQGKHLTGLAVSTSSARSPISILMTPPSACACIWPCAPISHCSKTELIARLAALCASISRYSAM